MQRVGNTDETAARKKTQLPGRIFSRFGLCMRQQGGQAFVGVSGLQKLYDVCRVHQLLLLGCGQRGLWTAAALGCELLGDKTSPRDDVALPFICSGTVQKVFVRKPDRRPD